MKTELMTKQHGRIVTADQRLRRFCETQVILAFGWRVRRLATILEDCGWKGIRTHILDRVPHDHSATRAVCRFYKENQIPDHLFQFVAVHDRCNVVINKKHAALSFRLSNALVRCTKQIPLAYKAQGISTRKTNRFLAFMYRSLLFE